jgi:hypothetical protein
VWIKTLSIGTILGRGVITCIRVLKEFFFQKVLERMLRAVGTLYSGFF